MRILWCITGGEDGLSDVTGVLPKLKGVTVVFSTAGEEVAKIYGLYDKLVKNAADVVCERQHGSSAPLVMKIFSYDLVVVAPATANTVAKVAHGIADSLVSNVVSQAIKAGIVVRMMPTDGVKNITGKTIIGKRITLTARDVDLENIEKIKGEVRIVYKVADLVDKN
jgi:flavoprotein